MSPALFLLKTVLAIQGLLWFYMNFRIVYCISVKNTIKGTSLVAQWLRICLPMQGTWVRALVREDPTCRGGTKPVLHNY